jgi:hypothetical protein
MIVYTVYGSDGDVIATKREAVKIARALAIEFQCEIEVERHVVSPLTKKNLIYILNTQGGGWSAGSEIVAILKPKEL